MRTAGMPDEGCGTCAEHSGIKSRNSLIVWLLGILISLIVVLGTALYNSLSEIKTTVGTVAYRFKVGEDFDAKMETRINQLESRMRELELASRE
jgi:hypothetical protein